MRKLGFARPVAVFALLTAGLGAQSLSDDDPGDFVRQGRVLSQQGKQDEALLMYRNGLQLAPDSWSLNHAIGISLDLMGSYPEARERFAKALRTAPSQSRIRVLRDTAISYAFENSCPQAIKYDRQAYDLAVAAADYNGAAEIANELARICLEAGDLDSAFEWYKTGYDTGVREPGLKPDRRNLWEFRWEHAQARIAARRGNKDEAQKHAAAAKAVLAKGDNPAQEQFVPYLDGYVAFYGSDYKIALEQFQRANLNDPFILSMIARTYEKLGNVERAQEYYARSLGFNSHTPNVAFSRPIALKKAAK